jgi:hypothetical protein
MSDTKDTNPKQAFANDKIPLHMWPAIATAMGALGLLDGAYKYGRSNWREAGVLASTYRDALSRHMDAWFEGQDNDPASGLPHLCHALACLAIIVDAQAAGLLTDDRMYPGGHHDVMAALTPHVGRLREMHKGRKEPRHYDAKTVPEPSGPPDIPPRIL